MRLLLAEDETELSNALVTLLKHNQYSVDAVYNGLDAYDYITGGDYDGVILDIMMPGMDGITVLKKVRGEGIKVPVLMLTAKSEIDDRVEGLDAGADDYLTKPFAMKELLARVRAMTRRQGEVSDMKLSFGNIVLDRSSFTLYCTKNEENSIRLNNKEFQMMEMFLLNPGNVISADRLMEKIWGYDSDADQNSVWVYISNLRKKLSSLDPDINIKAVRGLGYSLEEKN